MIVGAVVLVFCLLGIATRADDAWASFWPANAILVGMVIRWPQLSVPGGWIAAAFSYVVADMVTGTAFSANLWLNASNIVGVVSIIALLRWGNRLSESSGSKRVLLSALAVIIGSVIEAVFAVTAAPLIDETLDAAGLRTWIAGEVNQMAIFLPPILLFPGMQELRASLRATWNGLELADAGVFAVLFGLSGIAIASSGPGAIAIPVPGLILVALRYNVFLTSAITTILCAFALIISSLKDFDGLSTGAYIEGLDAVRLGIASVAIAPIVVSTIYQERARLIERLEFASNHDFLTGALTRAAFMSRGGEALEQMRSEKRPFALMMVDIDYFKHVNDRYGHSTGDLVLIEFARIAQGILPEGTHFGRFGGEEFAVIMPGAELPTAVSMSMRLRAEVERAVIGIVGSDEVQITLSVGLAYRNNVGRESLDSMLAAADASLYRAKESGRNQVIISEDPFTSLQPRPFEFNQSN